jgi:hypothetical protein
MAQQPRVVARRPVAPIRRWWPAGCPRGGDGTGGRNSEVQQPKVGVAPQSRKVWLCARTRRYSHRHGGSPAELMPPRSLPNHGVAEIWREIATRSGRFDRKRWLGIKRAAPRATTRHNQKKATRIVMNNPGCLVLKICCYLPLLKQVGSMLKASAATRLASASLPAAHAVRYSSIRRWR